MHPLIQNILKWVERPPFPSEEASRAYDKQNLQLLYDELRKGGIHITNINHLVGSAGYVENFGVSPDLVKQKIEHVQTLLDLLKSPNIMPWYLDAVVLGLGDKEIVKHHDLYDQLADIYEEFPPRAVLKNAGSISDSFANSLIRHFRMKHLERHKNLMLNEKIDTRGLLLYALKRRLNYREVRDFINYLATQPFYPDYYEFKKLLKSKAWQKWSSEDE